MNNNTIITEDVQKEFMCDQVHEIEVHKWIASEKVGRDLGQQATLEWIRRYAKEFRDYWFSAHST